MHKFLCKFSNEAPSPADDCLFKYIYPVVNKRDKGGMCQNKPECKENSPELVNQQWHVSRAKAEPIPCNSNSEGGFGLFSITRHRAEYMLLPEALIDNDEGFVEIVKEFI